MQTAPGQVQLTWQPVSGVAYYGLFGPGVASGGQQVMAGSTSFTATNVPGGSQTWTVGSFYLPGPVATAMSAFPAASLNVTAPTVAAAPPAALSGKYLVTITGMRAYQQSVDDMLSRDGVGDEVYAAAYVRRYDRKTGQLVESISRQSAAYGDVNKFANQRIQAGTSSATGGIRDGDMIPDGPMIAFRTLPAQDVTFPWKLWEGTLTDDSDMLVISPSLWEQDGSTAFYDEWVQQQAALNLSLFTNSTIQSQISQKEFGMVVSGMSGTSSGTVFDSQLRTAVDMTLMQFAGGGFLTLLQTKSDRPIGLLANGADAVMLPNRAVVLSREIIEAALAKPAPLQFPSAVPVSPIMSARLPVINNRPGVMMLHFADSKLPQWNGLFPERPAVYQMFLQVERIP